MKKLCRNSILGFCFVGLILIGCNNPSSQKKTEEPAKKENLQEQSDNFDKKMTSINDAMEQAKVLNEKIQIVEKQVETGEISREKADELIKDLNDRYSNATFETDQTIGEFPEWLKDLKITEPKGLTLNETDSYQTSEADLKDGYNSVLFIYSGDYNQAMAEANRIAAEANIPLSEPYQKAKDLADKLGKKIEGIEGVSYVNYKFGDNNFDGKYKISLSVDKDGKFTIHVVDEKMKNSRKEIQGMPQN